MQVRQVHGRGERWQVHAPIYRVTLWTVMELSSGATGRWAEEYELTGCDVDEVLAWVASQSTGWQSCVWVVHESESGTGVIRLAGREPPAWRS